MGIEWAFSNKTQALRLFQQEITPMSCVLYFCIVRRTCTCKSVNVNLRYFPVTGTCHSVIQRLDSSASEFHSARFSTNTGILAGRKKSTHEDDNSLASSATPTGTTLTSRS